MANFKNIDTILTFRTAFFSNRRFYEIDAHLDAEYNTDKFSSPFWVSTFNGTPYILRRRPIFLEYQSQIAIFQ